MNLNEEVQEMRELGMPTKKTNPIHNDLPENTTFFLSKKKKTFLLFDQSSGEANTTVTLIGKIDEVTIIAKTSNWKAIVIHLILQSINKRNYRNYIPFDFFISINQKFLLAKILIKCIIKGFYHKSNDVL